MACRSDSAIISSCYNRTQKQRLNAAGKKAAAAKKKLLPKHYDSYIAVNKPTIETSKVPISTSELVVFKAINKELQMLDNKIVLAKRLDQSLRKEEASRKIQLFHSKCKRIDMLVMSRKQQAHKQLIQLEKDGKIIVPLDTKGARTAFTTQQWRDVLTQLIDNDKAVLIELQKEFCCDVNGKIAWSKLTCL